MTVSWNRDAHVDTSYYLYVVFLHNPSSMLASYILTQHSEGMSHKTESQAEALAFSQFSLRSHKALPLPHSLGLSYHKPIQVQGGREIDLINFNS